METPVNTNETKTYELTHPTNISWTKIRFDVLGDAIHHDMEVHITYCSQFSPDEHKCQAHKSLDEARNLWKAFIADGWERII
jgi:hypothetical protein